MFVRVVIVQTSPSKSKPIPAQWETRLELGSGSWLRLALLPVTPYKATEEAVYLTHGESSLRC